MNSDKSQIEAQITTYFESMYESSAAKVDAVFHPDAKISGYMQGEFHEMSRAAFSALVASEQPSPAEQGANKRLEILSIEIAGQTAVARVRDDYLGTTFLDTLSFIKLDGQWLIYTKLFHIEA